MVAEAAKSAGVSLRELAKRIGVSYPTIYAYSSGALAITASRLKQIADALGVPVDALSAGERNSGEDGTTILRYIEACLSGSDVQRGIQIAMKEADAAGRSGNRSLEAELRLKAGAGLVSRGKYLASVAPLETARRLFIEDGTLEKAALCAQHLGHAFINIGELDQADKSFQAAKRGLAPLDRWRAEVALAALAERRGDFRRAEESLNKIDTEHLSDTARAYILFNRASVRGSSGWLQECCDLNRMAFDQAKSLSLHTQVCERALQIAYSLLRMGRYEEASLWVIRGLDLCEAYNDSARATFIQLICARLLIEFRAFALGRTMLLEAQAEATKQQYRRAEALALENLCVLHESKGDWNHALEVAQQYAAFCAAHEYSAQKLCASAHSVRCELRAGSQERALNLALDLRNTPQIEELGEPFAFAEFVMAEVDQQCGNASEAAVGFQYAVHLAERCSAAPIAIAALTALTQTRTDLVRFTSVDSKLKKYRDELSEQTVFLRTPMGIDRVTIRDAAVEPLTIFKEAS